jgi:Protein of unknown function (DUF3024)
MPSPQATIRSSLAEQLGHRLFMRHCARPTCGHPLLVGGKRCLYLSFFQDLSRRAAFHRPEPSQVGEWHDGGSLPAKVNHLVWLMWAVIACWLRGHAHHGTRLGHRAAVTTPGDTGAPVGHGLCASHAHDWSVYWTDRNGHWHRYDSLQPGRINQVLREIESDPTGTF